MACCWIMPRSTNLEGCSGEEGELVTLQAERVPLHRHVHSLQPFTVKGCETWRESKWRVQGMPSFLSYKFAGLARFKTVLFKEWIVPSLLPHMYGYTPTPRLLSITSLLIIFPSSLPSMCLVLFVMFATLCDCLLVYATVCFCLSVVGQERSQLSHDFCVGIWLRQKYNVVDSVHVRTCSMHAAGATSGHLKKKQGWVTFPTGEKTNVFCFLSSLPHLPSVWLLPAISLLLTKTVSTVRAWLFIWLERFRGS